MTRVNVIPVQELTDQHLLSELREAPRIFSQIEKYGHPGKKAPKLYMLGTGHVHHFCLHSEFIYGRVLELYSEWLDRGYSFDFSVEEWTRRFTQLPQWSKLPYTVTDEALAINRARIAQRIAAKPSYYKMKGKPYVQ